MTRTISMRIAGQVLTAVLVLATAGVAAADHYPRVPRNVERKDRSVLDALRRLTYNETVDVSMAAGECSCIEESCENGNFMMSCGGEMRPSDMGFLNAVRRTSQEACLVCGCAAVDMEMRASLVCVGF